LFLTRIPCLQLLLGLLPQSVVFHNKEDTTDFTKPPLVLAALQDTYNREPNWLRRGNATAAAVDVWRSCCCTQINN
jgi:hypothetical protein